MRQRLIEFRFLSTLSLRRATGCGQYCIRARAISIHALLAESDLKKDHLVASAKISIHALLAESDEPATTGNNKHNIFLSTLSLRRATISDSRGASESIDFYPRSPCGERHDLEPSKTRRLTFLSTLSLRRATLDINRTAKTIVFLSTLSLRRATFHAKARKSQRSDFYPRSPCGERLHYDNYNLHCVEISIHALLAESDFGEGE